MERTPYLRYLKECLEHAEDSKVFDADALLLKRKWMSADVLPELSQVQWDLREEGGTILEYTCDTYTAQT